MRASRSIPTRAAGASLLSLFSSEMASAALMVYLSAPTQSPSIINTIAWDNRGGESYAETAQIGWAGGTPPTVTYTCIQNKSQLNGTGNISSDSDFSHGAQGDHRLHSDSPCRDTGLTAALRGTWPISTTTPASPYSGICPCTRVWMALTWIWGPVSTSRDG